MISPAFLRSCASPVDLLRGCDLEPASPACEIILDALYATQPTAAQREVWSDLSGMPWPSTPPERAALCIGRRGLKTSGILAPTTVYEALCVPHEVDALAGSRVYFVVVAPRLAQSREATRAIRSVLDAMAPKGIRYEARDAAGTPELVITSPTSTVEKVITVFPADAVAVRGFAVAFLGIDEAGFLASDETLARTDKQLLAAVEPAMVQFRRRKLLLTSSPGAPGTFFHRLVTEASA